jgi:hypothetical protein
MVGWCSCYSSAENAYFEALYLTNGSMDRNETKAIGKFMQKAINFMWIMFTSRGSVMTYWRDEVSPFWSFLIIIIIIIIIIIVPPINMDGCRKTASQIAMKFRVYIYNYNSDVCSKQNLTLTNDLDLDLGFTFWSITCLLFNRLTFWFFYIVGLTNGYKKVCDDVYVTVTFSYVTGAVINVTCYNQLYLCN